MIFGHFKTRLKGRHLRSLQPEVVNRIQNVGSRARFAAPRSPGEPETRDSRDSRSLNWVREPRPRADLGLREIWVHRRA